MIIDRLVEFGLTKNESKVYLFLSKNNDKIASDIAKSVNTPRSETYHILDNLKQKGIVTSDRLASPIIFHTMDIGKSLDVLINNLKKKLTKLEKSKDITIELWESTPEPLGEQ